VGTDNVAQASQPLTIGATVTDDGKPTGALLTALWTQVSGPGTVTFGDDHLVDTTATFSDPGTYTLRLTVSDSLLSGFDELNISVS
jgi:PKD repeat protein